MKRIGKLIKKLIILSLELLLLYWVFSIAKCEILTIRHGEEFRDAWIDNTMISCTDYIKVLDCNDTFARVYYVCNCKEGGCGNTIFFLNDYINDEWDFVRWDTIWSSGGNADEIIWPYIR